MQYSKIVEDKKILNQEYVGSFEVKKRCLIRIHDDFDNHIKTMELGLFEDESRADEVYQQAVTEHGKEDKYSLEKFVDSLPENRPIYKPKN